MAAPVAPGTASPPHNQQGSELMTQSTEVARRSAAVQDVTDTRKVEAHAIAAQTHLALAAAMVEVYARTEGLPLAPVGMWFYHSTRQPSVSGHVEAKYGIPAHEQRQLLHEWADALGAEVTESRTFNSQVKLAAKCLIGGVPVSVEIDVDHRCSCTGQCRGDVL